MNRKQRVLEWLKLQQMYCWHGVYLDAIAISRFAEKRFDWKPHEKPISSVFEASTRNKWFSK